MFVCLPIIFFLLCTWPLSPKRRELPPETSPQAATHQIGRPQLTVMSCQQSPLGSGAPAGVQFSGRGDRWLCCVSCRRLTGIEGADLTAMIVDASGLGPLPGMGPLSVGPSSSTCQFLQAFELIGDSRPHPGHSGSCHPHSLRSASPDLLVRD